MKIKTFLAATILALGVHSTTSAVDVGEKAPAITADYWINTPSSIKEVSADHLKGRLVLLEFWATWCGPCKESIPHLIDIKKKYESKGLLLVALSDEPRSKVAPFVEKNKMPYVIGGGAKATLERYGINSFPSAVLIDPDGKVVWTGHPAVIDSEIAKALKANAPKKKGGLGAASAEVELKKADKLYRDSKYADAMELLTQVAAENKGNKHGKKANEQIKKMKGNSSVMESIRRADADRECSRWLACARILAQNGEKADAAKFYDKIINDYGEFQHAKVARAERNALGYDGKTESSKPSGKSKASAKKAVDEDEDEAGDDEDDDSDDEDDDEDHDDDDDDE